MFRIELHLAIPESWRIWYNPNMAVDDVGTRDEFAKEWLAKMDAAEALANNPVTIERDARNARLAVEAVEGFKKTGKATIPEALISSHKGLDFGPVGRNPNMTSFAMALTEEYINSDLRDKTECINIIPGDELDLPDGWEVRVRMTSTTAYDRCAEKGPGGLFSIELRISDSAKPLPNSSIPEVKGPDMHVHPDSSVIGNVTAKRYIKGVPHEYRLPEPENTHTILYRSFGDMREGEVSITNTTNEDESHPERGIRITAFTPLNAGSDAMQANLAEATRIFSSLAQNTKDINIASVKAA